uniref:Isopenicillin N synthase-like Fe(2+) 2OG dioxygenase domain-containing protein n=1 Tax=Physcomitrium patens TaxID=3218 RepID=A0A7I4C2E7_PHYPA
MGAMAAAGVTSPARIKLKDLVAIDGLSSQDYKIAVASLSQSLRNFNAAIIQVPQPDDVLLRCVLDSVRMFFHSKPMVGADNVRAEDPQNWNRTAGYYAEPQHFREVFDYRPGRMNVEGAVVTELPPTGLPELFAILGNATRVCLDAIACSLEMRSFSFTDLLDNMPLKPGEMATSVLSSCCHNRPGAHHPANLLTSEQGALQLYEEDADKGLLTLMKSDKPGLQIRDLQGRWFVVDADLGPQDMILYTGTSLYQATGGYLSPSFHRTDNNADLSQAQGSIHLGRCTVAFKLMPRATAILHCSAMTAAGHAIGSPFQHPVAVHDFMQRTQTMDQLLARPGVPTFSFTAPVEVFVPATSQLKAAMKRKKQVSRGKPLAPSKRLRLEAQRVLKERVQEIADAKGLKIRYCNLKECEEQHLNAAQSPCGHLREAMNWPVGVPFVHPHDLPNKAKQAFLEAYEPGWSANQDSELGMVEVVQDQHGQMLPFLMK